MPPRKIRHLFLTDIFHSRFGEDFDKKLLARAPKGSSVEYVYQFVDGTSEGFTRFRKLVKMDQFQAAVLSDDCRLHHRLRRFCQYWTTGQRDRAVEMIEAEMEYKRQKVLDMLNGRLTNIESSAYKDNCSVVVDIASEMKSLKDARTLYRRRARKASQAKYREVKRR